MLNPDHYSGLCAQIEAVVREASSIMLEAHDPAAHAHAKSSGKDLVTIYDVAVQKFLAERLLAILPDAGFLGEEEGARDIDGRDVYFVVDPIDGTSNFIADYKHSAISVALVQAGAPNQAIIAVCYDPYLDEMFTATRGGGARLNGTPIQCSTRPMADSLVLFGTSPYNRSLADATFAMVKELFLMSRDIRRGGAAVLDLCYVAAGRAELFYEMSLSPWDYAAASLVATEAGAFATDLRGQPLDMLNPSAVIVGSREQHGIASELADRLLRGTAE